MRQIYMIIDLYKTGFVATSINITLVHFSACSKNKSAISLGLRSRPIRNGNRKNVIICTDCSDFEIITYTFGPSQGKTYLRSFRQDYCNYQPAQSQMLARILKFCLSANKEDVDQTTQTDLCRCFTQPPKTVLARLLKKLYFYCYLFIHFFFFFFIFFFEA